MIHILHLPGFPEKSKINPDCISCLCIDIDTWFQTAHIVLNTPHLNIAKEWTNVFLKLNPVLSDDVALTKCSIFKSDIPVKLEQFPELPGLSVKAKGIAYFVGKKDFEQEDVPNFLNS